MSFCQKSMWLKFGQNGPETLAKNFICHFFWYFEIFSIYWDFNAKIPRFWPNLVYFCLKILIWKKFQNIKKNGRWSFLPVSQDHFDHIPATYHAFWQILSKKCEIHRKLQKNCQNCQIWVKSYFFSHIFSSQCKFFDLESIKPIKLLILGKFWVMRQNNSKITDKKAHFKAYFCPEKGQFSKLAM